MRFRYPYLLSRYENSNDKKDSSNPKVNKKLKAKITSSTKTKSNNETSSIKKINNQAKVSTKPKQNNASDFKATSIQAAFKNFQNKIIDLEKVIFLKHMLLLQKGGHGLLCYVNWLDL